MAFMYVLWKLNLKFTIKIFQNFNQILRVYFHFYIRSNLILYGQNNFMPQRMCVKESHI